MSAIAHFRCAACGATNRIGSSQSGKQPICGRCKSSLDTTGRPQDVNSPALARAVRSTPVPVLADFWAPWCGPCKVIAPVLDAMARQRAGNLLVLKVNSDENQEAGRQHKIAGIPTLILFANGAEVARQTGALPRAALELWLTTAMG